MKDAARNDGAVLYFNVYVREIDGQKRIVVSYRGAQKQRRLSAQPNCHAIKMASFDVE